MDDKRGFEGDREVLTKHCGKYSSKSRLARYKAAKQSYESSDAFERLLDNDGV